MKKLIVLVALLVAACQTEQDRLPAICPSSEGVAPSEWRSRDLGQIRISMPLSFADAKPPRGLSLHGGAFWSDGQRALEFARGHWGPSSFATEDHVWSTCVGDVDGLRYVAFKAHDTDHLLLRAFFFTNAGTVEPGFEATSPNPNDAQLFFDIFQSASFTKDGR